MIAQFLSHDLKSLLRLLTVNQLFVYAVVPLMLDNLILNWQILHDQPRFRASLEKLLVLILTSVITHNRESLPKDPALVSEEGLEAVLRPFNLQLSQPVLFQLLKDCFKDLRRKTTVDFSNVFQAYGAIKLGICRAPYLVQLIEPPPEVIEETIDDFGLDAVNEAEVERMEEDPESGEDEDKDGEDEEGEEGEEMYVDSEEDIESESDGGSGRT